MAVSMTSMNLVTLILGAVLLAAGAASAVGSDFRPCDSKNYPVTIKDVVIDPEPVVSGDLVTFTIPAYASEELKGGTVVVTVSLYGFKVHTERDDLCGKTECPIKGDFSLSSSQALPVFTPPGQYKLKFQVLDLNGKEQACASVGFAIVWKSSRDATVADMIEEHPSVASA
ncbi:hypothetical protein MPTK1_8g05740 [Marchantia polymorpha subsp. ruderalis]|nr:hypothetical protein MARPO_0081s0076 [Marchantia polymorpha]BBN18818.1 hypothetical protein Mp_8g05740 [Marchantia polymorpha subsp. ruderalis]|eukprot:PTQ34358.1 hypothetical protein MARPO_0081s0076 [Marchantia polymorpha]